MKIVAIETLCAREFENVLSARVHTDAGLIGLGETFYGAGAVAAHIHDTLAARLFGRDPLRIEAHSQGARQFADGAVEHRRRIPGRLRHRHCALGLWGKATNQPVHQMLGGLCRDKLRIYNTCAGYQYVRNRDIRPVDTWNSARDGPYEDLNAFTQTRAPWRRAYWKAASAR